MNSRTKQITITAILLAICIASQFFKNLSVYITGPIINACLVICTLTAGLPYGIILSIITPVTAFLITGNPLMSVVPALMPLIMAGNAVLVIVVHLMLRPAWAPGKPLVSVQSVLAAVIASAAKGLFMGLTISLWLLPNFIPAASPLMKKLPVFQSTFSIVQFTTALIGFVYAFIVWIPLGKSTKNAEN